MYWVSYEKGQGPATYYHHHKVRLMLRLNWSWGEQGTGGHSHWPAPRLLLPWSSPLSLQALNTNQMLISPKFTSPSRPLPPHQTLPYTQLPPLRLLPVSHSTPNVAQVLLHLPSSSAQLVSNCSGQKLPPFSPHTRFFSKSCPSKHKKPTFLTILFLYHSGQSHHCVLPFLQIQQWALSLG